MGKKRRIVSAVVLIAAVGALALALLAHTEREPSYQGKTLSQYLNRAASNYTGNPDYKMLEAIHQMGPAAIPPLRRALRRRDSAYERSLRFLHAQLPQSLARRLPATNSDFYLGRLAGASARCLAVFGPQARQAVPDLIQCFNQVWAVNQASYAVHEIGLRPEHLSALLVLIKSTNWGAPRAAAECIGQIGVTNAEVFSALTNMAGNGPIWDRHSAIGALSALGKKAVPAVPTLVRNLQDTNAGVRIASAEALCAIEQKSAPPAEWFIKELDNELNHGSAPSKIPNDFGEHEINLLYLANILAKMGGDASNAVPLLRALIKNEPFTQPKLRLAASLALWKIDRDTNDFVFIRSEALTYFDPSVQQLAAKELMEFCLEKYQAVPELDQALSSKDPAVGVYGARALWKLTGDTARTAPVLAAALDDHVTYGNTPEVRKLAADTLAEMGGKATCAVPALVSALSDAHENIRLAATNALKLIEPQAAAKAGIK